MIEIFRSSSNLGGGSRSADDWLKESRRRETSASAAEPLQRINNRPTLMAVDRGDLMHHPAAESQPLVLLRRYSEVVLHAEVDAEV